MILADHYRVEKIWDGRAILVVEDSGWRSEIPAYQLPAGAEVGTSVVIRDDGAFDLAVDGETASTASAV